MGRGYFECDHVIFNIQCRKCFKRYWKPWISNIAPYILTPIPSCHLDQQIDDTRALLWMTMCIMQYRLSNNFLIVRGNCGSGWTICKKIRYQTISSLVCSIGFSSLPKKKVKLKIAITLPRKKIQCCSTASNEPQSSHYGRRSMVSEPYLDHKKSYGLLKFRGYRKMIKIVFATYLLN